MAPRAEVARSGARGGRRSGTLDGIFHNWGRCTKTATTPEGPKTPATVAFSRSSQDLPLLCSDIGKESSAAMSENFFGTFSTRRQPPAAVGLTRALQIFPKSGPTPNPEHSAHGARLRTTSYPQIGTFHIQCHPSSQVLHLGRKFPPIVSRFSECPYSTPDWIDIVLICNFHFFNIDIQSFFTAFYQMFPIL